jgi:predicted transcriptional regulator
MTDLENQLRDQDRAVLQQIQEGNDDVQKITSNTTLENHQVNYCFEKLEQLGLINVHRSDGYTERIINGQKRVFQNPKQAQLTSQAETLLEEEDIEPDQYRDLSREELVDKTRSLEQRVDTLETRLERLTEQFRNRIQ